LVILFGLLPTVFKLFGIAILTMSVPGEGQSRSVSCAFN